MRKNHFVDSFIFYVNKINDVIDVFVFVYYKADEFGDVNTVQRMSNEICFLASTCLSWWFADRSRK